MTCGMPPPHMIWMYISDLYTYMVGQYFNIIITTQYSIANCVNNIISALISHNIGSHFNTALQNWVCKVVIHTCVHWHSNLKSTALCIERKFYEIFVMCATDARISTLYHGKCVLILNGIMHMQIIVKSIISNKHAAFEFNDWLSITIVLLIIFTATTDFATSLNVSFSQSSYSVNEDDGVVQPVLVLSNSSSTNVTIQIESRNITATGN